MSDRQTLHLESALTVSRLAEYRKLILEMSMSFINLPLEKMDDATARALEQMATFFSADRAYVFSYDFDARTGSNTHEWCAEGIEPAIDSLQNLPIDLIPDWVEPHKQGEPLLVGNVEDVEKGSPLRELLESQGIKSLLTAPLMDHDQCLGFVGFDLVRDGRNYGAEEYELLVLFANLLVSINQRKETSDALYQATQSLKQANQRFINILDGTHAAVYVADMKTYEVLFVNRYSRELLGDVVGQTCWKTIQNNHDGPCKFCTNNRLLDENGEPNKPVVWEHYNPVLKRWYQLSDQAIPWDDGRYVRMEIAIDITQRKNAEFAMQESEQRYRTLFDQSRDALLIVEPPDWTFVTCNSATIAMFGFDSEADIVNTSIAALSPERQPDGRLSADLSREYLQKALDHGSCFFEWEHKRKDGHIIPCSILLNRTEWSGQTVIQGTLRDISAYKQAERALKQKTTELTRINTELEQLATVFTHANEGITITQPDGTILEVNDAMCQISGYDRTELVGNNPRIFKSDKQGPEFYDQLWHQLKSEGHWDGEIWNQHKNGELYAINMMVSCVKDSAGRIMHYVALATDITKQLQHQRQLEYIAHYDTITSLPNRNMLAGQLKDAMSKAQANNTLLAIAYLDLDGFKAINDQYGHDIGDKLLALLARTMQGSLRAGDTLARLGGDEFVAVLADVEGETPFNTTLNRLLEAASQPVVVEGFDLQVSASLGVTTYPQSESIDADQLLRQADQAMYEAKLSGKNRFSVFDTRHHQALRGHNENIASIESALNSNEFLLFYQPKVNMRTGEVKGVEALVRWQHKERGLLLPGNFLPEIQNHPLSIALDDWVMKTALAQSDQWRRELGLVLPVSVNIGALQLQQPDFVDKLKAKLDAWPEHSASNLELEVLETSALEDIDQVSKIIKSCEALGVQISLDDFGTGYSSLTYLKRLPAHTLKIDQSFVRDMLVDNDDLAILVGILGLAKAFRREVIAEGVETVAHGERLLDLGCEFAQGYGIARPMPAEQLYAWVQSWRPPASWLNRPVK